ncbi:PTS sugar transporter subunit IIA [Heyndrickxia coagulans]|uniref:PTS sugar transporter subunit IIA n=1 Tax=Heyndrickxia coagulans TaxID=1398 RepID=A0AAW7CF20_HEYCO|nr:PTS sugar transporter subunit IIA [Heyndrickxia coagulans]MDL5039652.1 PTS sugar transporter subunit IIA [Heyndrickxia coagulans]
MEINSIYQVYFNCELKTKEEVYSFIAETVGHENLSKKEEIIYQLYEREKAGSTLIAEHVMLPHIVSHHIKKSKILFIRLANPIPFLDAHTEDICLLIVILLKENESAAIKKKISLFTRSLADEEYLNRLLNSREEEKFIEEIFLKQEE